MTDLEAGYDDVRNPLDLSAIKARAAAATPGPWQWRGNVDHSDPHLAARGRDVLGMVPRERKPTDREADSYREYLRDVQTREGGTGPWRHLTDDEVEERLRDEWLTDQWGIERKDERMGFVNEHLVYDYARDLAIFEVCPEATSRDDRRVYRADIKGIRHPDAEFIAHSRQDVADLLAEVDRLRAVERHAREVMEVLGQHGASIVGHLLDNDDNAGEYLRRALRNPASEVGA